LNVRLCEAREGGRRGRSTIEQRGAKRGGGGGEIGREGGGGGGKKGRKQGPSAVGGAPSRRGHPTGPGIGKNKS